MDSTRSNKWRKRLKQSMFLALMLFLISLCSITGTVYASDGWLWVRGSLHTHTTNSDGDSPPEAVADWYKENGYQFLVITDHETVTDVASLDKDPNDNFVVISGEEVAMPGEGAPIHANAIGITHTIKSPKRTFMAGRSVRRLVDLIRGAGGIPMVNHPNWYWALNHRDLLHIQGPYLLEVFNMGSDNRNAGDYAHISTEQMWDILLSEGQEVYATATDDMHLLKKGAGNPDGPACGWVVARVRELTPTAIMEALARGDFYASNGVEIADYSFDGKEFRIKVVSNGGARPLIRFIGKWGRILQETEGTSAVYRVAPEREKDSYVRCKVIVGKSAAWTQAYRLKGE